MNRADLQQLGQMRIDEATLLLAHRHWSGAYYLAGYAVECALKACIAKRTQRHDFRDFIRLRGNDEPSNLELWDRTCLRGVIEGMRYGKNSMELLLRIDGANAPQPVPVTDVSRVY